MQWLRSSTGLKVIALVLATIIWFFVKNITSERRVVESVPVEVKLPPGFNMAGSNERTVNVILRGTRADIWQVSHADLLAVVDLQKQTRAGKVRAAIEPRAVRHPSRVQVVQVVPDHIEVKLVEQSHE